MEEIASVVLPLDAPMTWDISPNPYHRGLNSVYDLSLFNRKITEENKQNWNDHSLYKSNN